MYISTMNVFEKLIDKVKITITIKQQVMYGLIVIITIV